MIILGIDPSINDMGWAVLVDRAHMHGPPDFPLPKCDLEIVDFGVIRSKFADPYDRLLGICNDAMHLRDKHKATDVVIETTSGKLAGRLKGTDANMLLYPVAVGGLVMTFELLQRAKTVTWFNREYKLHLVRENLWTGGQPKRTQRRHIHLDGPKRIGRHEQTLAEFGLPKKTTDHETDAIGLVAWWTANRHILKEMKACPKAKRRGTAKKKQSRKRTSPPIRART